MPKRILAFTIAGFLLLPLSASAWEFAGWYGGGCYPTLVTDPGKAGVLFLGSDVAGVWKSIDGGDHWTPSSRGLGNLNVAVLAIGDGVVYAGTKSGLYKSADGGASWVDDSRGMKLVFKRPFSHRGIYIVPGDASQVILGTHSGDVFVGSRNGKTWEVLGTKPFGDVPVDSVIFSKKYGAYYAASKKGFAVFDPATKRWRSDFEEEVSDMVMDDTDSLYLATGDKVAYSLDGGKTWKRTDSVPKGKVARIAVKKTGDRFELAVGIEDGWNGGVYISEDGRTWTKPAQNLDFDETADPTRAWNKDFSKSNSLSFDPHDGQVLYYTDWWGVWRSNDLGKNWNEIVRGSANAACSEMFIDEAGTIYAACMDQGVLSSKDGGASYTALLPNANFPDGGHAWRIGKTSKGTLAATFTPWNRRVFEVMTGDSESFTNKSSDGLPVKIPTMNTMWGRGYPRALAWDAQAASRIYMGIDGDDGGGLFVSEDEGKSWQKLQNQPASLRIYNGLAAAGDKLFWGALGGGGGVYVSEDRGQSWTNRLPGLSWVFDLLRTDEGVVFAAGADGKASIYRSMDDGKKWKKVFTAQKGDACEALAVHPTYKQLIVAGIVNWNEKAGGRVIYSEDGGDNWMDITAGLPESTGPAALAFNRKDGCLYALLYAGSVYKTKVEAR